VQFGFDMLICRPYQCKETRHMRFAIGPKPHLGRLWSQPPKPDHHWNRIRVTRFELCLSRSGASHHRRQSTPAHPRPPSSMAP